MLTLAVPMSELPFLKVKSTLTVWAVAEIVLPLTTKLKTVPLSVPALERAKTDSSEDEQQD